MSTVLPPQLQAGQEEPKILHESVHCFCVNLLVTIYLKRFEILCFACLNNLCGENQLDALFTVIYFVKKPLHVSGIFIAHHQEVFTVHVQRLVRASWYQLVFIMKV
jgi:hypothetical protein